MPKLFKRHALATVAATAVLIAGTHYAQAAGFQLKEQSAEGQGNSFAGSTAKAYDASTIFFNPAGMSELKGHKLQTNFSGIAPDAPYEHETLTGVATTLREGNTNGGSNAIVPSLYGVYDLNEDVKLGLSINTPFGLATEYDRNWAGAEYNLKSEIETITATPSVSYKVNDQLSIGAGVQMQYLSGNLTRQASPLAANSLVDLSASDFAFGGVVGALYKYSDKGRIGFNYRSQVKHTLEGSVQISGAGAGNDYYHAHADLTTPDVASIGWYHELNDTWAVMSDVAWTNWSVFDKLDVVRDSSGATTSSTEYHWDDTMFYSVGVNYQYDEQVKLQTGVAYDQGAASDEYRTAGIPDTDRYWFSLGAEYKASEMLTWNAGYSYLYGEDAKVNESSKNSNFSGTFKPSVHILSVGLSVNF
jgi:long-chain fatty acid transport protein